MTNESNYTVLPDGSAFGVMSFPLPKDHWLFAEREYEEGAEEPKDLPKPILTHAVRNTVVAAIRYAVRGATNCGKESDFDPDALVQNAVYALCGPYGKAECTVTPDHIEDVRGMVPVALWEGSEEWEQLAYELCIEECDYPHQLIWEGGPILEPWGERWQRYEGDAKRMIEMVRKYVRPADCPRCAELEATNRQLNREVISVGDEAEDYAGKLAALEAENARLTQYKDGAYTALQKKNNELDALQSTVAQQAERIKELESYLVDCEGKWNLTADALVGTQKQLAAAERDAERYRYLRSGDLRFAILHWKKQKGRL